MFTSNVFAIVGMRALYFLLAGVVQRFHLLKYALGTILVFVGLKMAWLNRTTPITPRATNAQPSSTASSFLFLLCKVQSP